MMPGVSPDQGTMNYGTLDPLQQLIKLLHGFAFQSGLGGSASGTSPGGSSNNNPFGGPNGSTTTGNNGGGGPEVPPFFPH